MRNKRKALLKVEVLEGRVVPSTVANDPRLNQLWGLDAIHAPEAWDLTTGDSRVIAAVVDSGVDYTHPDLYRNIWLNQAEIPKDVRRELVDVDADGIITFWDLNTPANQGPGKITDLNATGYIDGGDLLRTQAQGGWADGLDDGKNGYADDLIGWDFFNDDNDPMDDSPHGTHVAGTIGAVGDNGTGVTGVNWRVQMMPVKLISGNDEILLGDVLPSYDYMLDNGARVSNHSYAFSIGRLPAPFVAEVTTLIREAGAQGHLFVASAGNDRSDNDLFPFAPASADAPNVITVAATNRTGHLASFSNWGLSSVDLAAPGVGIRSTVPGVPSSYGVWSGTSMAAPHVTGAVALLLARNPDLSAAEVKDAILDTVDLLADLTGKTVTGGQLNLARALQSVSSGEQGGLAAPAAIGPRDHMRLHGHLEKVSAGFQSGVSRAGGSSVAAGDFNGDGRPDLVQTGAGAVEVLLGRGDGTFLPPRSFAAGVDVHTLAVGDFNGDGKVDVIAGGPAGMSTLLGNGDGTLQAPRTFALPRNHVPRGSIVVADLNRDGTPDLAVDASEPQSKPHRLDKWVVDTFVGRGDGTFRSKASVLISSLGAGQSGLAVADFNGDGKPDVLATGEFVFELTPGGVFLLTGRGDGGLASPVSAGSAGRAVTVGDYNADGRTDFAVVNSFGTIAGFGIGIFLGNGNGTFRDGGTFGLVSGNDQRTTLAQADMNGDGKPDLITTLRDAGTVSVLLGNGDGTFQPARTSPGVAQTVILALADFDGDGDLDLAMESNRYLLSVLLNDGNW